MRTALVVTVAVVLLVLLHAPAQAQDSATTGLKPDLPLEFPVPRSADPYKQRPDDLGDGKSPKKSGTDDAVAGGKTNKPGTVDPGDDAPNKPGTVDPGDDAPNKPGTVDPGDDAPNKPGTVDPGDDQPEAPSEVEKPDAPSEVGGGTEAPSEVEKPFGPTPTEVEKPAEAPVEQGPTAQPIEEEAGPEPIEEGPNAPPEEEGPRVPPPEFFDEPIEAAEVIFVIDRSGSMRWPSKMSVIDENGNPANNLRKYDVVRIELIKAISDFSENVKFGIVGFSTYTGIPVWPTTRQIVVATEANKSNAITWARARLNSSTSEVSGGTPTYDGMSVGLKMVSAPPPGKGPGGNEKKSATSIYMLTDGCPTHIQGQMYCNCYVYGSYDAGEVRSNWDRGEECIALTKAKILGENVYRATIYTLGMGMNMACPHPMVGGVDQGDYGNQKCRQFMTELAEATGGHYREISQ